MHKRKIVIIVTVPVIISTWLKGQCKFLSQYYEVEIITSNGNNIDYLSIQENVLISIFDILPAITPFNDLKVIFQLAKHFKKNNVDIVYTYTPKAGLLGMIAARIAGVKKRIHNVVGLPLMEATGLKRLLFNFTERVTYLNSTQLFCNSFGLREYLNQNLTKKQISLIWNGSVNGVDTNYFQPQSLRVSRTEVRTQYKIDQFSYSILYIGRLVKDKGVEELIDAFKLLNQKYENTNLILLGDYQERLDPLSLGVLEEIKHNPKIHHFPHTADIRPFLALSDVFILPSYREGLPNVLLEAGSFGLPLIATNINGCNEVITNNENGLLINPKSENEIFRALECLYLDKSLCLKFSLEIRKSVQKRYEQEIFWEALRVSLELE